MGVGFILYTFSNVFLFFRGKSIAANIFATLLDKVKIQKQKFSNYPMKYLRMRWGGEYRNIELLE